MYIIYDRKLSVKLILTTDPFDCAQDRFHRFSQIQQILLPQRERAPGARDEGRETRGERRGMRDEGRGARDEGRRDERRRTREAMGNLEYRILNDEGDLRRNRRLSISIRT
jgi:hypothetical protein